MLIKDIGETIENEAKDEFLGMLLGLLCASLLGSLLAGEDLIRDGEGQNLEIRSGQSFQ